MRAQTYAARQQGHKNKYSGWKDYNTQAPILTLKRLGHWLRREGWARRSSSWLRCLSLYGSSQLRHLFVPDEFGKILLCGYSKITVQVDNSILLPGKDKWHHHRDTDNYTSTFFFVLSGNYNFHIEVSLKEKYVVSNASIKHSMSFFSSMQVQDHSL